MRKGNGFTLIELLVVITIISVLAGLLLPGIMRAMQQAKANRALSEMQHLATVITQVYSEVGYYVTLESLIETSNSNVYVWLADDTKSTTNGRDDEYVKAQTGTNQLSLLTTAAMWSGPYTTYKNYSTISNRPLDPWGTMGNSNADTHQYRMFWIAKTLVPSHDQFIPAGATGAMVIISAGGDGKYQCNIAADKNPANAVQADFSAFNPALGKGDDVYYIFNAGIQ